ncbi:MAG: hypothetical protein ABJ308_07220 [Halieaceae bacterium]
MQAIDKQHWAWLLTGICLVALAWTGSLDAISAGYVNDSLLDAGIIYATARGINALVSALQGTELDMWLVTFSIGELLDPINDMIERFSGVMTVALASLVIQQLLLVMVSDVSVSVALTLLAVATVIAFMVGRLAGYQLLLKTFLVVALLRFSLALVLIANLWVDQVFLADSSSAEHAVMQDFQGDLEQVDQTVRGEEGERSQLPGQFESLQEKFDAFVANTLSLLGAMLLKAVLIPLLFLYAVLRLGRLLLSLTKPLA